MEIQDETPNYDEYNQNNRLVNDVNYSYYFNKNQNLQKNENNNENSTNNISNENNIVNNNNLNENNNIIENNNDIKNNKISTPYNSYNYNTSRISSTIDIKADERRRKKILLNNIQTQINLRKKTKLEELEKEKEEDKKYLKEMFEQYPFGRGGGGAPVRNKKGEVVAFRRNLISDYKYNQSGINIDDDFDEVWGKRKNNNNADISNNINLNNRYNPNNRPFSTINVNSNNNNFNNINNNYNMSSSYDFNNNNNNFNYNYNNDLDNKIYERRMKLLQLQKEKEEIKNEELKQENIKLENDLYTQSQLPKKNIPNQINLNTNEECITETETETTNNNNTIPTLKNNSNNLPEILNPKDYYDNINFVPKGKINPRLDNNFLFTEEISKLRKDIEMQQTSLLKQISQLKDASLIAKNERNKVYKDLEIIKYQINELKEAKNIPQEKEEENFEINNNNNIGKDHEIVANKNYNYNDYDYIDNKFFSKFEKELPYNSNITKEKKIFHLEKNYEDKNLIELDKLIKKSEDIMQNLKENELLEEKFKKKPEDYFDTSDYFFDTYMLSHKNDYLEYANEYKNKYGYYNANNKFMEYNINKNNNINNNNDYEINIEPI